MKILIAADIFPPDIGGPATYSSNLAQELAKRGHKVLVVCYGKKEKERQDGYKVIKINRQLPLPVRYFSYFFTLLRVGRSFDIFYAQGPVSAGLPTMLAAWVLRKKYLVKVVGDYAWEQARGRGWISEDIDDFQKKSPKGKVGLFCFVQKKVVQRAQKVIVPSLYLKSLVEGWGAKKERIEVIYNSPHWEKAKKIDLKAAQDKIGIKGRIALFVGRLVPWKGLVMLIEIWPKVLKKDKDWKLVIVGEGPEEERLEKMVKEKKLEKNIFLVGKISRDILPFYFSAADIFVLNSGYEGFSHVLLEALCFGLPVIASDKGGNMEIIKNGFNGFLVEYNNKEKWLEAILGLASDQVLREKLSLNSSYVLEKFKNKTTIEQIIDLLENFVNF